MNLLEKIIAKYKVIEAKVSATMSSFLKTLDRVKRKGRPRWKSKDGSSLFEWDELHGEIEVYNRQGEHTGLLDANGKAKDKPSVEGRKIDV